MWDKNACTLHQLFKLRFGLISAIFLNQSQSVVNQTRNNSAITFAAQLEIKPLYQTSSMLVVIDMKTVLSYFVTNLHGRAEGGVKLIGHFRVAFCFCFKTSPGAQHFICKLVLLDTFIVLQIKLISI